MSEQEFIDDIQPKQYVRNYTEEGREKKIHLDNIRKKAMEKKRELKEITLKAKLMKLEPKLELAKQYDEYINQRVQPIQAPQAQEQEEEQVVYVQKPVKEKKKKIIYKEVEDEEEEEEEIVYVKKNKPKQETLERTLYKSSTEQLHLRAVEERIRHNLAGWHGALMPREY
jgi:hypothetical protein